MNWLISAITRFLKLKFFHYPCQDKFTTEELTCNCGCGFSTLNYSTIIKLNQTRFILNSKIIITSGCRCSSHNNFIKGSPNSSHLKGLAIDISCPTSSYRFKLIISLFLSGFNRIGIGKNFIHADDDLSKPSFVIWVY